MKKNDKTAENKQIDKNKKNEVQKALDDAVLKAIDKSFASHKIFKKVGK